MAKGDSEVRDIAIPYVIDEISESRNGDQIKYSLTLIPDPEPNEYFIAGTIIKLSVSKPFKFGTHQKVTLTVKS